MSPDKSTASNVLIGTPAYAGQVHVDFVHGLMDFVREQIRFRWLTIGNESLITRARNTLLSHFHRARSYSHLLFLDGDVQISGQGLSTLLDHDKAVIGAPVALKRLDAEGNRKYNYHGVLSQEGSLAMVEKLGTAVLLLRRDAVDALVADAIDEGRVYEYTFQTDDGPQILEDYDVFQVGVDGRTYLSEDFWVCRRLRTLGFEIHMDTSVSTSHSGVQKF